MRGEIRITRRALTIVSAALLLASGSLLTAQEGASFAPHPSTQEPSRLVTLEKLKQWEKELSNWGRWGKGD